MNKYVKMYEIFHSLNIFNENKKYSDYQDEIDPYDEDYDDDEYLPVLKKAMTYGQRLEDIKIFHISFENMRYLDGIDKLINLEILNCSYNDLKSLDGIETLKNLKELYCYNNELKNLGDISKLKKLNIIACYNNDFNDSYKKYLIKYCKDNNIHLSL